MKKILCLLLFFILLRGVSAENIDIPVTYDTLDNGLRVIIVPDSNVAVVSCRLYYFVGGMNEGPGTTGLSHMYEHMMFKGTERLGSKNYEKEIPYLRAIDSLDALMQEARLSIGGDSLFRAYRAEIFDLLEQQREYIKNNEIWEIYQSSGGTNLNAWTSNDMTAYIVTLPQNKVELFYWIEADRMENPVLREFHSELEVVMEERKMRYDNRPLFHYWERLNALFYVAHPFGLPVIGWESDIKGYTTDKLMRYINEYYTPDNALIVLVGNVDSEGALEDIEKYFGSIPRAERPSDPVVTREPAPIGETRFTARKDAEPRIDILFHTPGYPHEDLYTLDILNGMLAGRSGRLYRRLVEEESLCVNAGASNVTRLHNGYFHVWAQLKTDADPEKVEKIIMEELEKVTKAPPTEKEMIRITNEIRYSFATGLKSLEQLSDRLAHFERLGSWENLLRYPQKIADTCVESVPEIANKYFQPEMATIGRLLRPIEKEAVAQEEHLDTDMTITEDEIDE
ncbi:pitrilysin family protein [Chitinispirillales bacterium ANBcel5]|uniref:M16 family metallopeptidase n=1 Tax=Cellulosispirillum alkaliphilum TaxID=3039283 RepID=UPI002A55D8D0|nr:pitrilysin family protein [Chitinispirillales bacterium ANBcel5]